MLPKDATPAQQDSAIRAWFHPGEIHYSDMPDTLHLPGHGVGRNLKEVNLPQYYRESFYSFNTPDFSSRPIVPHARELGRQIESDKRVDKIGIIETTSK